VEEHEGEGNLIIKAGNNGAKRRGIFIGGMGRRPDLILMRRVRKGGRGIVSDGTREKGVVADGAGHLMIALALCA
jgi:hypothetical protein